MVYIKKRASNDLQKIRSGLLEWEKVKLTEGFVLQYVNDIFDVCFSLESLSYHKSTTYLDHVRFGKKVYAYKRNDNTTWYIIYDIDKFNNIYIKKIISNYLTKK